MGFLDGLREFVLGESDAPEGRTAVPVDARFPRPIDFIEALKAAMRDEMLDITPRRAIVPGHYTVLLHNDAHAHLEPAFGIIARAAGEELTAEVDRLSNTGYPDAPEGARREIHPLDYTWSLEFVPVMYDPHGNTVPKNYIGIATKLNHGGGAKIIEDPGATGKLSLTTKNPFSGVYESHFILGSAVQPSTDRRSVTLTSPFGKAPQTASTSGALANLTYSYPGNPEVHCFAMTVPEIILGRETAGNSYVHLRFKVEVGVSEEHCRIRHVPSDDRFELMDLSTYGTWVDEVRVPKSDPKTGKELWHPLPGRSKINLAGYMFLTFEAQGRA